MAITSFPFENTDTTETQYSTLFQELQDPGVVGSFGSASLVASANSSSMSVTIAAGLAFARGFVVSSTASEVRAIGAAASTPRIDTVVARFDPANNGASIIVLPGTPNATPSPPALTQTATGIYDLPLADVAVPAGAVTIAAGNVTDRRPWVGHRVGVWSTTTRPLAPRLGRLGLNTTRATFEHWNGSTWVDLAPVVTWTSVTGKPATFTPAAHTHPSSQVVGLDATIANINAAIAGKANSSHSHSFMDIHDRDAKLVQNEGSGGRIMMDWNGTGVTVMIGTTPIGTMATSGDIANLNSSIGTATNTANAAIGAVAGKADGWGNNSSVKHAQGPTGGAYGRESGANRYATWMDSGLEFGRAVSSRRYKEDIADWDVDVEAVLSLVPKTFHRKVDDPGLMDFGAIAEDVHDAGLTELVYYDDAGRVDGIRDHHLPWALLAVAKAQERRIRDLEDAVSALLNRKG